LTPSSTSENENAATPYRIELTPAAKKSLDRLHGADLARLRTAIEGLANHPLPRGARKLAAKRAIYRIRVGDYRVIYAIHDRESTVLVTKVARRTTTTYR
jgi:mRNA interferase RelE/StbE